MANPTTDRPARPVFSSGLGFGATCKSFIDCSPVNGMPIELVSGMPGRPWEGELGYGVGYCPRNKPTGFSPGNGVTASPCLKFGYGSPEIIFMGRGFSTGDGVQRTMAVVCRIDFAHPPGDLTNYGLNLIRCKIRTTSNSINAMSVKTSKDGPTIEAVTSSGGSLTMDGINRVNGRWYAFALSTDQTASPYTYRLQIYDFTTQTLGSLYDRTSTSTWPLVASTDLAIGGYSATDVFAGPFRGMIACAILDKQFWDATLFQNFYQDPWATVRGTYSTAGTFTAPANGWFTHGEGGCKLSFSPATGTGTGGTGSPTYHLQRYTNLTDSPSAGARVASNITPDAGGAIINTPLDETTENGIVYGFRLECVDGSSTVYYPPTNQTPILGWRRASGTPLLIMFPGDSRTANKTPAMSPAAAMLSRRLDRPVCFVNRGLSGTYAYQWTIGVNGRNTVQITGTPSTGTFGITVTMGGGSGINFRNVPWNCTASLLKAILEDNSGTYTNSVPNGSNTCGIGGSGNVTATGGPLPGTPIQLDFDGPTSSKKSNTLTITGGSNTLNNSATPSVTGVYIGASPDANCWNASITELQAILAEDSDLVPWWHCAVGTNDMNGTLQQVVDYQRYLEANIAYFAANGIKCVYSPPPMLRPGATNFNTAANMEIGRQYAGALEAIADGITCFYGGNRMNALSILEPLGSADGLHGYANGAESADERMGWADGLYNAINPSSGGGVYPAPFIAG